MNVLFVHCHHQSAKLTTNITGTTKGSVYEQWLKPTIEILDRAIALRLALGDEDRLYSQAQAQANGTTEIASGKAEAAELAPVVELDLLRQAQLLPGMYQKVHHHVHFAAVDELDVDRLVENVFADRKVVAGGTPFQVTWPNDVNLMHVIRVPRLWPRILVAGYTRCQS